MPLQLGKDYKATIRNVCVQSATWWNEHEIQCQDFQQLRISQGSTRKLHRLVLLFEVASSQKACVLPKSSLDIQDMTWPLARAWDRDRIAHLACSALSSSIQLHAPELTGTRWQSRSDTLHHTALQRIEGISGYPNIR